MLFSSVRTTIGKRIVTGLYNSFPLTQSTFTKVHKNATSFSVPW